VGLRTAVVILNWNGRKLLEQFLPSVILHSRGEADIYVADNFSEDDSLAYISSAFPEVRLIRLSTNYGFAGGYNHCLDEVDAEYFILLNSDIEVTAGWIAPVISLMDRDNKIGVCQPKIRSYAHKEMFEYAGAAGGFIDHYGYPFCRGRIFNSIESDKGQYDEPTEVFWATGACMFIRSSLFRSLKGFDSTFFAHMEEIDLCWRVQRNGFKVMVQPAATVFHVGGGTLLRSSPRKTYLNFRNNILMLHKNLSFSKLMLVMPLRFVLDGVAAFKFLITHGFADFFAVVKAHFYFYTHLSERRRIRRDSRPSGEFEVKGIYKKSLVFEYYIARIKKFSQLDTDKFD